MATGMSDDELIEKLRDLVKRCERALGEENVVTLDALNQLGCELDENGEYEEAIRVHERCLAGRMKVLGEDHKDTLATLNNLGIVYDEGLKNYEKALESSERALKVEEKLMGKALPSTLTTVMNIAIVYDEGLEDYEKPKSSMRECSRDSRRSLGKITKRLRCVRGISIDISNTVAATGGHSWFQTTRC